MSSKTSAMREIQGRLLNAITLLSSLNVDLSDEGYLRRTLTMLRECEDDMGSWFSKPLSLAEKYMLKADRIMDMIDPDFLRGMLGVLAGALSCRRLTPSEANKHGIPGTDKFKDMPDESILFIPILRNPVSTSISFVDLSSSEFSACTYVRASNSMSELAQGLLPKSEFGKVVVLVNNTAIYPAQDENLVEKLMGVTEMMLTLDKEGLLTFRPIIIDAEAVEEE